MLAVAWTVACGDNGAPDSTSTVTRVPSSASFGEPTAPATGDSTDSDWAQAVCAVLDKSILQPESISVAPSDVAAFLHNAASNSQQVADDLGQIEPAPGTSGFTQAAIDTFESLSPLLSDMADELDTATVTPASSGAVDLRYLQALLASRENLINQKLGQIRDAYAALPAEAARAIAAAPSCGLLTPGQPTP